MSLLNAVLAWGALAFTVPLAIHLLFRTRFRTMDWGAMFLLTGAARINRRRMQWLQWLLLFLRCAIPVLLAFAMARPLLKGQQASSRELPQSLLFVFDDSRSMDTRDSSGDSVLAQSKLAAQKLLAGLTRRDEVMVIRTSQLDTPASVLDRGRAEQLIRSIEAVGGPYSMDQAVQAAIESLSRASHPDRRIVVVSDFQDRDVTSANTALLKQLSERTQMPDARTTVSFLRMTEPRDSIANVSVDVVRMESSAAIVGRMTEFVVELHNASDETAAAVPLRWSLDGQMIETKPLDVPPRGSQFVRFRRRFQEVGLHEVTFSIDLDDALPADNRRSLAVDALPAMDVMVIDGKPSRRPLQGTADFLMLALQPQTDDQSVVNKFRVNRVSPRLVASGARALRGAVVVVCNVSLDRELKSKLADHVLGGGTVVIFDGDLVNENTYNTPWIGKQGQWEIPFLLGDRMVANNTSGSAERATAGIGRIDKDYSPWALLMEKDDRPLADVLVTQWRELLPRTNPTNSNRRERNDDATEQPNEANQIGVTNNTEDRLNALDSSGLVLLRRMDDRPLVVLSTPSNVKWNAATVRDEGEPSVPLGDLVYVAFAPHPNDTTLPLRPSFVPLIQQMLLDIAGRREDLNLKVGQTFAITRNQFQALQDGEASSADWWVDVQSPTGKRVIKREKLSEDSPSVLCQATLPGRYTVLARSGQAFDEVQDGSSRTATLATDFTKGTQGVASWRLVQIPAEESDLRSASKEQLESIARTLDASVFTEPESLKNDARLQTYGREFWRPLCLGLMIALVGELLLLQFMDRRPAIQGAAS